MLANSLAPIVPHSFVFHHSKKGFRKFRKCSQMALDHYIIQEFHKITKCNFLNSNESENAEYYKKMNRSKQHKQREHIKPNSSK